MKPLMMYTLVTIALLTAAPAGADDFAGLTTDQLVQRADRQIAHGAIHSHRWGDASPYLRRLCYELVRRAFAPYGTQQWALYVVRRESGCNPGAINSTSGTTGIAQIHPRYHRWIDYARVQRDMRYALRTFLRLSRNGRNTGPWCLC